MDRFIDTIEWIAAAFVGIVALNIFLAVILRNTLNTAMNVFSATMPTKAAATHSIESMKRSIGFLCTGSGGPCNTPSGVTSS
jgi:hypothetical protein